jgi:hypothetical protein
MKKNINTLLLLSSIILLLNCVNKEISMPNTEITIKVINNITKKPFSNAEIELQEVKKSIFGQYFWEVHKVLGTKLDENGVTSFKIDSLSTYRILVTPGNKNLWSCSYGFEAQEIGLNKVHIIRCLDDSEKEVIREQTIERRFEVKVIDYLGNPISGAKVYVKKEYSSFTRNHAETSTDSYGLSSFETNKVGVVIIIIKHNNLIYIEKLKADEIDFDRIYDIKI